MQWHLLVLPCAPTVLSTTHRDTTRSSASASDSGVKLWSVSGSSAQQQRSKIIIFQESRDRQIRKWLPFKGQLIVHTDTPGKVLETQKEKFNSMLPNHLYITERKRKVKHVYLDANKAKCMQYSKSNLEMEIYCDKFWVGTRKDDQEIEARNGNSCL